MNDYYDEELTALNEQIEALTEKRNVVIHNINRKKVEEVFGNIFNKVFEYKSDNGAISYMIYEDITQVSSAGYAFSCYQFTPTSLGSFNFQYYGELTYANKVQFDRYNIEKFETSDALIELKGHLNRIKQLNIY